MPQLDISAFAPQIIWLIITFLILYILMSKIALPRIGNILEQRQARIDDNLEMAQNLRKESDVDAESYEKTIEEAQEKARRIIQETANEMSIESSRRQEELGIRLSNELEVAEDRISEVKVATIKKIHELAEGVTSDIMKTLIEEKPSKKELKQAISMAVEASNKGDIK